MYDDQTSSGRPTHALDRLLGCDVFDQAIIAHPRHDMNQRRITFFGYWRPHNSRYFDIFY